MDGALTGAHNLKIQDQCFCSVPYCFSIFQFKLFSKALMFWHKTMYASFLLLSNHCKTSKNIRGLLLKVLCFKNRTP